MKKNNNETMKITLLLIILVLFISSFFFCYKNIELIYKNKDASVNSIKDKTFYQYRYDKITKKYAIEEIKFSSIDRRFVYRYFDLNKNEGLLDECANYLYTFNVNKVKLLCGTDIQVLEITKRSSDKVTIKINDNEYTYFDNIEKAYKNMK